MTNPFSAEQHNPEIASQAKLKNALGRIQRFFGIDDTSQLPVIDATSIDMPSPDTFITYNLDSQAQGEEDDGRVIHGGIMFYKHSADTGVTTSEDLELWQRPGDQVTVKYSPPSPNDDVDWDNFVDEFNEAGAPKGVARFWISHGLAALDDSKSLNESPVDCSETDDPVPDFIRDIISETNAPGGISQFTQRMNDIMELEDLKASVYGGLSEQVTSGDLARMTRHLPE